MRTRHVVRSLLVFMLLVVPATPALANSLASWVWVWPGAISVDPLFGLLPTVLVSFVERPFVSRAGVQKRPLLRSIRANLVSFLAGIPLGTFVWFARSEEHLVRLAIVAVAITVVLEIGYFRLALRKESNQLHWAWIVFGNVVSNLLLVGLAITIRTLQENYPELSLLLTPYQGVFVLMHIAISFTMVTAAIAEPTIHGLQVLSGAKRPEPVLNQALPDGVAENVKPNHGMQPTGMAGRTSDQMEESLAGHPGV